MLRGALAASITPLREHGSALDDDAFEPLCDFYVAAGLDGLLALGTAGRGSCSASRSGAARRICSCRRRTGGFGSPSTAERRPLRTP